VSQVPGHSISQLVVCNLHKYLEVMFVLILQAGSTSSISYLTGFLTYMLMLTKPESQI